METVSVAGAGVGVGVAAGGGVGDGAGGGTGVGDGAGVPEGFTVRVAERETLPAVAVICTDVTELTCRGMMLKLTDFVPVETVTLVGIDTFELLLFSCTVVGLC